MAETKTKPYIHSVTVERNGPTGAKIKRVQIFVTHTGPDEPIYKAITKFLETIGADATNP
jgi:hypothetical protein